MASRLLDAYTTQGTHAVGNLNSWKVRVLPYGAIVDGASIDNFTIGELGFNGVGERIVKQLTDVKKDGVLVAAPERRYVDGEMMSDFYNAVGERVRVVFLDKGLRFETSAFTLNSGVSEVKNGLVVHFDPTSKKFIVSNPVDAHADYENAVNKFVVVACNEEVDAIEGQEVIRLEVQ